ncbi:MAG: PadR family transcriptional regulator [Bacteroides sp.]
MGNKVFQNSYIDMLILKILQKKDMYGYELIQKIDNVSNSFFEMKAGTIYPILHTLEKSGYVISYEKVESTKQVRKYYHITECGLECLNSKIEHWKVYSSIINCVLEGGN